MATEKEANKAREQHSDMLESYGVHSIGIDEIGKKGSKNFGIIAFLEKHNKKLPAEVIIKSGNKKVTVPVVPQLSGKFKPE